MKTSLHVSFRKFYSRNLFVAFTFLKIKFRKNIFRPLIVALALIVAASLQKLIAQTSPSENSNTSAQLYGMTFEGGTSNAGTIFRVNIDGTGLVVIHNFNKRDGDSPYGSLIQTSDGFIFGMTSQGGTSNYPHGVIFRMNAEGSDYTVLHEFTVATGENPFGSLIQVSDGSLVGATIGGGTWNAGTIFKMNTDGSGYTVLHNFNFTEGNLPRGALTQASDGTLYGMTPWGGSLNFGTIYKIQIDGSGFKVLYNSPHGIPEGSLIQGSDSTLFGMAKEGGVAHAGNIFRINTDGSAYTELLDFNNMNGRFPEGSLIIGPEHKLYGMTSVGGPFFVNGADQGGGTIFKINMDGTGYTILHSFVPSTGSSPVGGSLITCGNKLFGYTSGGGTHNGGVVFNYDLATATYTVLANLSDSTGKNPEFGSLLFVTGKPAAETPTVADSNISFSNVLSTSMTVSFHPGNGNRHLAVMKAGGAPLFKPVDNNIYTGNVGKGEVVVYDGAEDTFNITGLTSYRTYYLTIFDYNSDCCNIKYLTDNAPIARQRTRLLPNVYLVKPGNGTLNQAVSLTLKANLVEGATTYTFEISTNSNFTDPKTFSSSSVSRLIDSLHYNTLYYAHVKTDLRDDYGKVTTFTTRTAESLAYVTWPANNAVNVPTNTAVASNKVLYANEYTIQLSETSDFSTIAFEATGPSRILHFTTLKGNTTYYSRVLVDVSSVFGPVRSFTTQATTSLARMTTTAGDSELMEFVVNVYPNPFQERLSLYIESSRYDEATVTLMDLNGRTVHESTVKTNATVGIEKTLTNGVYILHANSGTESRWVRVIKVQ